MQIRPLDLGGIPTRNNLFLAPMAGFTDYPFRSVILPLGVGLCFTELTSAKGLYYSAKNNDRILMSDDKDNTSAQIFGSDPYFMRWACESEYLKDYRLIDINMGCPVPKIVKNGEGSALLTDIRLAEKIVRECVKSGKKISVKIRTGVNYGDDIAAEFAKMAEQSGAVMVTIHGRVREAYYSGEVDYKAIERAKKAVNIPVIANGGVFSVSDAENLFNNTGADGIMIARGAIADPFIFCKLTGADFPQHPKNVREFAVEHLKRSAEFNGAERAAVEFRKFLTYYFKSVENSKPIRAKIMLSEDPTEITEYLNKYL